MTIGGLPESRPLSPLLLHGLGASLEFLDTLQRRKPQRLGVMRDLALSLALEARRPGIEGGDKFSQVMDKRLV